MYVTIKSNPKHTVLKSETVGPLTSIEDPEKALAPTLPDSRFGATGIFLLIYYLVPIDYPL